MAIQIGPLATRYGGRIMTKVDGSVDRSTSIAVVLDALASLATAIADRDPGVIVGSFESDASLLGTAGSSVGSEAIESYVASVIDATAALWWEWDERSLVVRRSGDVIWFFILGDAVTVEKDGGVQARTPMRLTGVLRKGTDDRWYWAQFHGSIARGDRSTSQDEGDPIR
jgi:hypothetical protein